MRKARVALGVGAAAAATIVAVPRAIVASDRRRWGLSGEPPTTTTGQTERRLTSRDGTELAVFEKGQGQPIVLIHGVGGTHAVWSAQFDDLSDRHRVVAFDFRGHGESAEGRSGYSPELHADDIAAVLETLDLRDAVIVGHSLGGTALGQFCVDYPDILQERVAGLVFVGTFASAINGEGWWRERFGHRLVRLVARFQHQTKPRTEVPSSDLAYVTARAAFGADPRPSHVRRMLELGARTPPSVVADCSVGNLGYDVRDRLGSVTTPALVIAGDRDRLAPLRSARGLEGCLGRADLVVFDDAGHMLMLERREEVSRLIEDLAADSSS